MSSTAAGRVLACLALVAACGLALLVHEQGQADGILVGLSLLGVVAGAVVVVRDQRRGRAAPGSSRSRLTR
ncbi:hypothetical protein ICW40_13930 [Actinotalea ferrariae]|uniref:hypothetical protein n=1 Tax=Actinotalea ferrariae TaxID=1386098 RepID=UPI001C8B7A9C|nr:hypothetical protein [Actinotalea ferrariae]MBX9245903.1 hypothetical protein [Actinotalea ferrariae]